MNFIDLIQTFLQDIGLESLADVPPSVIAIGALIILFIVYRSVMKLIKATLKLGCTVVLIGTILWIVYSVIMTGGV